jgi:hypothetical protein
VQAAIVRPVEQPDARRHPAQHGGGDPGHGQADEGGNQQAVQESALVAASAR